MPRPIRAIVEFFKRDWQRGRAREKNKWEKRKHRCTRCWYDMQGGIGDVCPECGTPKNRSENVWTDGRWHWRVGIFFALAVVFVVLSLLAIAEFFTILGQPTRAKPFLTHMKLVSMIELAAGLGLNLSLAPIMLLTMRQTTLLRHLNIRLLVPMLSAYLIVWIGQEIIGTIGRLMASP